MYPWSAIVGGSKMKKTDQNQEGFTLTEMLVALAVASTLIVSVGQLLSLTARAYHRVTGSVETLREYRSLDRFLSLLEAADSDAGSLAPDALELRRGDYSVLQVALQPEGAATLSLTHNGVSLERDLVQIVAADWSFNDHVMTLASAQNNQLLIAFPRTREIPFNCRYDSVAKRCR